MAHVFLLPPASPARVYRCPEIRFGDGGVMGEKPSKARHRVGFCAHLQLRLYECHHPVLSNKVIPSPEL